MTFLRKPLIVFFLLYVGFSYFIQAASVKSKIKHTETSTLELNRTVGKKILTLDDEEIEGKRVFVIGDVHGCYLQLIALLQKMDVLKDPLDPRKGLIDDVIIILAGDLVRKGPFSKEVMKFASRTNNVYAVRGNHEQIYIDMHPDSSWVPWIEELPFLIHIPKYDAFVAHAGMLPGRRPEEQSQWTVTHMRNVRRGPDGELEALERTEKGEHWAPVWSAWSKSMVYFGHDAGRTYIVQRFPSATGIDTRCVKGGELTAVQLPVSEEIFYTQKCKKLCL